MSLKMFSVALALAVVSASAAEKKPIVPMDIVRGTGELIFDAYSHAFEAAQGAAAKAGIPTDPKAQFDKLLGGKDPVELACSKAGCKAKDIYDQLNKVTAIVAQVKAQVYETGAKASDALDELAKTVVTKFETFVPSYKGVVPKTFGDVLLVTLYSLVVMYVVFRIARFVLSMALSIFCCFFCCGCFRGGKSAAAGKKGKKGTADAKASAPKAVAKKK